MTSLSQHRRRLPPVAPSLALGVLFCAVVAATAGYVAGRRAPSLTPCERASEALRECAEHMGSPVEVGRGLTCTQRTR